MNKIARIELYHVRIPLDKPFYPSWIPGYPATDNRFDLVRITTEDGVEGYSAGPAISTERPGLGNLIAPYLLGHDATDIPLMLQRLREVGYLGVRANWMEPAFWDIKGKLENKPVCSLFGAKPEPVEVYASTGEIKDEAARVDEALKRYEEGFRTITGSTTLMSIRISAMSRPLRMPWETRWPLAWTPTRDGGSPSSMTPRSGTGPGPGILPMPAPI